MGSRQEHSELLSTILSAEPSAPQLYALPHILLESSTFSRFCISASWLVVSFRILLVPQGGTLMSTLCPRQRFSPFSQL